MRTALHSNTSHTIPEDAYTSLSHHLANAAYPPFPENNTSNFGASSPPEQHALPSHIDQNGLHLDPNLSAQSSRHLNEPGPSTAAHHDSHDFTEPSTPSEPRAIAVPPPIPPNTAPPGQFDMLPPLPSTHPTWQALHTYAQTHASAHGYALSINTTAKNRSRIKLACVCYGAPKNTHKLTPETRVRKNRVSYKTGCKMWIEGKKGEDGLWALRVGEGAHNHEGRVTQGWAVQRKRTWGVQGGRVGTGGVTALEEQERQRMGSVDQGQPIQDDDVPPDDTLSTPNGSSNRKASHSLESGGLVWKIVEQEMLRKNVAGQGRDRGVGRTVQILEEKLPGIHIFKRDVYNIRAQIKRARKAAGQQLGENLTLSDDEENELSEAEGSPHAHPNIHHNYASAAHDHNDQVRAGFAQIDPSLIAQCNSALEAVPRSEDEETELERLRREVGGLRHALMLRTKEVEEKNAEIENLRVQVEIGNIRELAGQLERVRQA
ncbi:uncharacterized protein CC84DRAFT_1162364 [Paraphaeosphaeria sporulosa]|uniref:FAR1 domain-containing protein n=1 Tax=Paraphaeosphaeria sporulosa TaxID=1460663 RepID=A0A177CNR8_9PLEO|nr:uncharacterized protein CC84DRAFT_1162364 [Paraphaeosphaeria sporulosa]OAG08407.1 hypothetical protein CC84DRAFT_1162364 [Paraphaeosphaeria sporulosa]